MDYKDALTITFLGVSVVFIGLILTSLLISSFSLIDKVAEFRAKRKQKKESETQPVTVSNTAEVHTEVPSEIMAVLTYVLEVELRMQTALSESRYTFRDDV